MEAGKKQKHEEIKHIERQFHIDYDDAKEVWKILKKGTVRLFHGTTTKHLADIQLNGLKPRGSTKENNWLKMPSIKDRVYLTDRWQYFFAFHSWTMHPEEMWKEVIPVYIEVEVPAKNLVPDEDFMYTKYAVEKGKKLERKGLKNVPFFFTECLNFYGTCAHIGVIPPENIVSITVLGNPKFLLELTDKKSEYMKEWKQIRINGVRGDKRLELAVEESKKKYVSTFWFEKGKDDSPNGEFIDKDHMIVGFRPSPKKEGMLQAILGRVYEKDNYLNFKHLKK